MPDSNSGDRQHTDNLLRLWDISEAPLPVEVLGVYGTDEDTLLPSDAVKGRFSPWTMLPFVAESAGLGTSTQGISTPRAGGGDEPDEPVLFGHGGVAIQPGTRVPVPGSLTRPTFQLGHSSVWAQAGIMQEDDQKQASGDVDFPADMGPVSHLFRVIDGHLCLVGNDPIEHSEADRLDLPGGGFLAFAGPDKAIRTRMGDCLAPMRYGIPTGQDAVGQTEPKPDEPKPVQPGSNGTTVPRNPPEDRADGTTVPRNGVDQRLRPSSTTSPRASGLPDSDGDGSGDGSLDADVEAAEQAETLAQAELDFWRGNPDATNEQKEAARLALAAAKRDARNARRARQGFRQTGPNRYKTPDGREWILDFTTGSARYLPADGARESEDRTLVLGLGQRDHAPTAGVVFVQEATPEQRSAILKRIRELEAIKARRALTAKERADYNKLVAIVNNEADTIRLGLPGGGGFTGGRGAIVQQDKSGREFIRFGLGGTQRRLKASVSGIQPQTAQQLSQMLNQQREKVDRLRVQVSANDPNRTPEEQAALEYQLEFAVATFEDMKDGVFGNEPELFPETPEDKAQRDAIAAALAKPLETGLLTGTLFGEYANFGFPLAFNLPAQEPAHDLRAHGPEWGLGYFMEWGGYWRPVVPLSTYVPPGDGDGDGDEDIPDPEEGEDGLIGSPWVGRKKYAPDVPVGEDGLPDPNGGRKRRRLPPPPGGGQKTGKPAYELPPSGRRGKRNPSDPDELVPCNERPADPTGYTPVPEAPPAEGWIEKLPPWIRPGDSLLSATDPSEPGAPNPFPDEPLGDDVGWDDPEPGESVLPPENAGTDDENLDGTPPWPGPPGYDGLPPIGPPLPPSGSEYPTPEEIQRRKAKEKYGEWFESGVQGQGGTILKPARPVEVQPGADQRTRLGGGVCNPSASLVPRGGVRTIDAYDFGTTMTSWDVHEHHMNVTNQVISLINERFPFGRNTLDEAGLHLRPHTTPVPNIPGAFPGTFASTTKTSGEVLPWVKDHDGKWSRLSSDRTAVRTWGRGVKSEDIELRFWTGRAEHEGTDKKPRLVFDSALNALVIRGSFFEVDHDFGLRSNSGKLAQIDSELLTADRALSLPDAGGTMLTTEFVRLPTSAPSTPVLGDAWIVDDLLKFRDSSGTSVVVSSQSSPATGAVMQWTGSAWSPVKLGGILIENGGQGSTHTGTTAETDLRSVTIPSANLVAGAVFEIEVHMTRTGNNANATVRVRLEDAAPSDFELTSTGGFVVQPPSLSVRKPIAMRVRLSVAVVGASGEIGFFSQVAEESAPVPTEAQLAGFASSVNLSGDVKLQVVGKLTNSSDALRVESYAVRRIA